MKFYDKFQPNIIGFPGISNSKNFKQFKGQG